MKRTLFALTLLPLLLLLVYRAAPEAPRSPEPLETPASADFQDPPIAIASGPCRPCAPEETAVPLPETESIRLTRWDGEAPDLEEVAAMVAEVQNRVAYSGTILDCDYYRLVLDWAGTAGEPGT